MTDKYPPTINESEVRHFDEKGSEIPAVRTFLYPLEPTESTEVIAGHYNIIGKAIPKDASVYSEVQDLPLILDMAAQPIFDTEQLPYKRTDILLSQNDYDKLFKPSIWKRISKFFSKLKFKLGLFLSRFSNRKNPQKLEQDLLKQLDQLLKTNK